MFICFELCWLFWLLIWLFGFCSLFGFDCGKCGFQGYFCDLNALFLFVVPVNCLSWCVLVLGGFCRWMLLRGFLGCLGMGIVDC